MADILFAGWLWPIPVAIGIVVILMWFVAYYLGKRLDWPVKRRRKLMRTGRSLIPALPISGVLGTVWGLADTFTYIAGRTTSGDTMMAEVMDRFRVALNTTIWGALFALIAIVLYATTMPSLEAGENESRE